MGKRHDIWKSPHDLSGNPIWPSWFSGRALLFFSLFFFFLPMSLVVISINLADCITHSRSRSSYPYLLFSTTNCGHFISTHQTSLPAIEREREREEKTSEAHKSSSYSVVRRRRRRVVKWLCWGLWPGGPAGSSLTPSSWLQCAGGQALWEEELRDEDEIEI